MAFSSVSSGDAGTNQEKTSGTSFVGAFATGILNAGELVVVAVATDNDSTATSDAESNRHSGLSASGTGGSLTFTKAKEWTRGAPGAGNGATVSVWYAVVTANITTVTFTATFAAAVTAKAMSGYRFNRDTAKAIQVAGAAGLAASTSDPGITLSGLASSTEYLWFCGRAGETNVGSPFTPTSGWANLGPSNTSGGGASANMCVAGEFRISTVTSETSDQTSSWGAVDQAYVLVAFKEVSTAVQGALAVALTDSRTTAGTRQTFGVSTVSQADIRQTGGTRTTTSVASVAETVAISTAGVRTAPAVLGSATVALVDARTTAGTRTAIAASTVALTNARTTTGTRTTFAVSAVALVDARTTIGSRKTFAVSTV